MPSLTDVAFKIEGVFVEFTNPSGPVQANFVPLVVTPKLIAVPKHTGVFAVDVAAGAV